MSRRNVRMLTGFLFLAFAVVGCGAPAKPPAADAAVKVEKIEGSELKKLALSPDAGQRLGVATAEVSGPAGATTVPYAAIVYDKHGATWTYTNPSGLEFVRAEVKVDRVVQGVAYLKSGPEPGTRVVTVGAAELWGVETGVGGGH